MASFVRFLRDEAGPTAVEYAVMLALLLSAMVAGITFVGNEIRAISKDNVQAIDRALTQSESPNMDEIAISGGATTDSGSKVATITIAASVIATTASVDWLAARSAV